MSAPTRAQQQTTEDEGPQLVLPKRAKPSKAAGTDSTRPTLLHGHVVEGAKGQRALCTTDAYRCVIHDVPDDTPVGPVHAAALKLIERGAKHRIEDGKVTITDKATGADVVYPAPEVGQPPAFHQLIPEPLSGEQVVRVALNADFLRGLADALGVDHKCEGVVLDILVRNDRSLRPITVRTQRDVERGENGRLGVLMPIRVDR